MLIEKRLVLELHAELFPNMRRLFTKQKKNHIVQRLIAHVRSVACGSGVQILIEWPSKSRSRRYRK